jgi:hypothetical protein
MQWTANAPTEPHIFQITHYARIGTIPLCTILSLLDPQHRTCLTRPFDGKV